MTRDLLNDLPDWGLALIFVLGTVILALAGLALVCRFLPKWRNERSSQTVAGVAAMVMTIFALVLAFVIVNLYNSYDSAVNNVAAEATSLTELVQDAQEFPPPVRRQILTAIARYVVDVRDREFPALRAGHKEPRSQQFLTKIFDALKSFSPVTAAQTSFYNAATDELHTIVRERESRLDAAETSIPKPLLQLMILLAILTLAISLLIATHHTPVDVTIIVTIAIVVSAGLLTAVILQYPFSGSIAVTSDPFNSGVLAQIARLYP
jgi:Protein of unknown function (DUF4239)